MTYRDNTIHEDTPCVRGNDVLLAVCTFKMSRVSKATNARRMPAVSSTFKGSSVHTDISSTDLSPVILTSHVTALNELLPLV